MAGPDFSQATKDLLAFRSCLICNNPNCSTVTVGPSDGAGPLKIKIGEAAHIAAKRKGQARFDDLMSDDDRADVANGIWLCSSCHTLIDKNNGADFSRAALRAWKTEHEATIKSLLHSHRSPYPLIRKFTEEGQIAQDVVDLLESHGALFVDMQYEVAQHVTLSVERLRQSLIELRGKIRFDSKLKSLVKDLIGECRDYMNRTSRFSSMQRTELESLRNRVGGYVLSLRDDYGCIVHGQLNKILPR